jgi:Carboxypeptidase regulatory-like domain
MMHRRRWIIVLAAAMAAVAPALAAQEPAASPGSTSPATESSSTSKSKRSHANDLLLRGTVFNERGLAMREVKLRIRRPSEKKSHWETYTNSRGEFAIRVPPGSDYEIQAESKGFESQTRAINAKDSVGDEKITLHMQPLKGGK